MKDTLVLLHPFPLDSRFWEPQRNCLGPDWEILTPDLPGGSIPEATAEVLHLLDDRGVERAVVCGMSRGGYIAMNFARRHPNRLSGLILCDTRPGPDDQTAKHNHENVASRLATNGMSFMPETMKPRLFGETTLRERPEVIRRINEMILAQDPKKIASAARGMANRDDARPHLPSVTVPAMCIAGVEDVTYKETKSIAALIPSALFVEIPAAGHLSSFENPKAFNAALATIKSWTRTAAHAM